MTKSDYELLATKLQVAGYTVDTVYEVLEAHGFSIQIGDDLYENIYASRIIAIMHDKKDKPSALKL